MFWYSFKILPDRLKLIRLYPCGSLRQSIILVFGARVGHFGATPQSDIVGIWSRDLGVMATLSVQQKMPFLCAFITLRSVSPTSSFSASFNGNRVKNHPLPWTCPLIEVSRFCRLFTFDQKANKQQLEQQKRIPYKFFASSDEWPFFHGSSCQRHGQQLWAQWGRDPQVVWTWGAQDAAALHASTSHTRHQGHDCRRDWEKLKGYRRDWKWPREGSFWRCCVGSWVVVEFRVVFLLLLKFVVLLHHVFTFLSCGFFYILYFRSLCICFWTPLWTCFEVSNHFVTVLGRLDC